MLMEHGELLVCSCVCYSTLSYVTFFSLEKPQAADITDLPGDKQFLKQAEAQRRDKEMVVP